MDPAIAPDSPDGCTGHGPVVALGSFAVRKRKPRRLRQEGAGGSCHRDLWPADMMIRSAAARLGGAKSATGVFALALTRWRLASTDAGRKEALGLHELECRRLQAGTTSGFVEYFCFATGAGAECRVVIGSRGTTHSNDLNASNSKTNLGQNRNQVEKRFRKSKTHKLESYQLQPVFVDLLLEKP